MESLKTAMELLEYLEELEHKAELLLPLMAAFDQRLSLERLHEILVAPDEDFTNNPSPVEEGCY
jgi:hypothetical protein